MMQEEERYNYFESPGDKDQVIFLQDQVRRLTSVVREYQKKSSLPINEHDIEEATLEPWMTDVTTGPPLFTEYDNNIKSLKDQIKYYKEQFSNIQTKSGEIVEENNRLHRELRQAVEDQLNVIQQTDGLSTHAQVRFDDLKRKLDIVTGEKNKVDLIHQDTLKEAKNAQIDLKAKGEIINSLRNENSQLQDDLNQARIFAEGLQRTCHKYKAEHEKFLKAAQIQDSELDELKSQIRKFNGEIKTYQSLNAELQSRNANLKEHFKCLDKEAAKETITEKSAEGTIRKMQNEILELDNRVISYSKELEKSRLDKVDLEEQVSAFQKKNSQLEENEYQAILRVRDSVQLVENALLEREQAIVREQQKSNEVTRLQETVNSLIKESEEKTQKAVALAKSQTGKQIQQLMDDLHFHELEGAEKHASYEKLQREKISLQNELEKIYQEGPVEVTKAGLSLDELQKKLSKVELNRDECLLQIDVLQMTVRRYKTRLENDKAAYLNQLNELRKQMQAIKSDFDEVSESRLKLVNEVNALKKELNNRKEDNVTMDTTYASQVSSLQQKLEMKEKEHESRLHAVESTNKEAMNELREMLLTQQKNANKWRDESRVLCQKLERTINKLTQDNNALKRKNQELGELHNDDMNRIDVMEKEILSNKATVDKIKTLYTSTEERAAAAEDQLQVRIMREKQLEKERQTLNIQIDRLKLEISRHSRVALDHQQWESCLEGFG